MSATEAEYNGTWKEDNGDTVQIPDSYSDLTEYFGSILKAAQMANVDTELDNFGHEDVTVVIDSETEENIREVQFTVVVRNWKEHLGGESAYSEQDLVTYVDSEDVPDKHMYANGAFFHKLSNCFSEIFTGTGFDRPMLVLKDSNEKEVRYQGTVSLHRYDY